MHKLIVCFLAVLFFSCNNTPSNNGEIIVNELQIRTLSPHCRAVVVIPEQGCNACISTTSEFMIRNVDRINGVKYVVTAFKSKKLLKHKLGEDIFNHEKVIIDENSVVMKSGLLGIYPFVMYLDDTDIVAIKYLEPETKEKVLNELISNFH